MDYRPVRGDGSILCGTEPIPRHKTIEFVESNARTYVDPNPCRLLARPPACRLTPWQDKIIALRTFSRLWLGSRNHGRGRRIREPGRAAARACAGLCLGHEHVQRGSSRRTPGHTPVGSGDRLPVGRTYVQRSGPEGPPRCASLGARQRLPVE